MSGGKEDLRSKLKAVFDRSKNNRDELEAERVKRVAAINATLDDLQAILCEEPMTILNNEAVCGYAAVFQTELHTALECTVSTAFDDRLSPENYRIPGTKVITIGGSTGLKYKVWVSGTSDDVLVLWKKIS